MARQDRSRPSSRSTWLAELLAACREDKAFGFALMYRLLGVVSERLQATRLQLLDMHSPVAKRAGT